jgi:hypothetical protein
VLKGTINEKGYLLRIPSDPATSFRLIPPPCSDPLRHPIPKHSATPRRG